MSHILHQRHIDAAPADVFANIASVEGIRRWWSEETSGDASDGGAFAISWTSALHRRMHVVEYEADRRIVWEVQPGDQQPHWIGTRVAFDLHEDGEATRLEFAHTGWRTFGPDQAECNMNWARLLEGLGFASETGEPSPIRYRSPGWTPAEHARD